MGSARPKSNPRHRQQPSPGALAATSAQKLCHRQEPRATKGIHQSWQGTGVRNVQTKCASAGDSSSCKVLSSKTRALKYAWRVSLQSRDWTLHANCGKLHRSTSQHCESATCSWSSEDVHKPSENEAVRVLAVDWGPDGQESHVHEQAPEQVTLAAQGHGVPDDTKPER